MNVFFPVNSGTEISNISPIQAGVPQGAVYLPHYTIYTPQINLYILIRQLLNTRMIKLFTYHTQNP
jgi:hypothetical protein